jgi:RNA polymerase primary sigma factor
MVRINQYNPIMPMVVSLSGNKGADGSKKIKVMRSKKSLTSPIKRAPRSADEENCVNLYFSQIKKLDKMTLEKELIIANRIKSGDQAAVNTLVEANLKFVVAVCKNYRNQGLPFGDLINEGNLGLIKAAKRFDGNAGCRFISYAVWWIRQGILVALAEQSRFLNISPSRIGSIRQVGKTTQKLTQKLGREPDQMEVAQDLGMSEQLLSECLILTTPAKSLNNTWNGDGQSLEESLEDSNGESSDRSTATYLLRKRIATVLDQMEPRKAQVLRMSFGIGCGTVYTLREISEKLQLSRERVRQIKTTSIEQLRHPSKRKLIGI